MNAMKAFILAGGKGTRLAHVMPDVPKSLVPIGSQPLIIHQILLLKRYGISDICILTGHRAELVESLLGDGSQFGVSISYHQETVPLGTAGALKEIEDQLNTDFMVLYGDVMINMQLPAVVAFHREKRSLCTLVLHPNDHPHDSDLVEIDQFGRITEFHSKPHSPDVYYRNLVNAALYIMSPRILDYIPRGKMLDFGKNIFPAIVHLIPMYGYVTAEYLKDAGTPDRLKEVQRDYLDGKPEKCNAVHQRRAVFMDRDGVINREVNMLSDAADFELLPGSASAIKRINNSDYLACVVTNQSVIARNKCTLEQLQHIHNKMETTLGQQGAKLDAIYYCPHHPDSGFPDENPLFKIDCDCRKPKTGMIDRAVRDFNIRLDGSYMIGDSGRDIECGRRAGLITILVRTGRGSQETNIHADYCFEDLEEAVTFIFENPFTATIERIEKRVDSTAVQKPFIISVGGNARSGKTTFSRSLFHAFTRSGLTVLLISLDNWIISKDARSLEMTVDERFQLTKMENDIEQLLNGHEIAINCYDSYRRACGDCTVRYQLHSHDIVIFDGVVALHLPVLRSRAHLPVFCEVDTWTYQKRFFQFYRWKGMLNTEIEKLFRQRITDEYQFIKADRTLAEIIVQTGEWDSDHYKNSL